MAQRPDVARTCGGGSGAQAAPAGGMVSLLRTRGRCQRVSEGVFAYPSAGCRQMTRWALADPHRDPRPVSVVGPTMTPTTVFVPLS